MLNSPMSSAAAVALWAMLLALPAHAEMPRCCQTCGDHAHTVEVLKLVKSYESAQLPVYECRPEEVFHPQKAMIHHFEHRCDKYCALHRKCDGSIGCCCTVDAGCKHDVGASPNGCRHLSKVKRPSGELCETILPRFEWISVRVCKSCYERQHHRR